MTPQEKKKFALMSSVLGILLVLYIFVNDPFGFFEKGLGSGKKIFPSVTEEQAATIKIRQAAGAVVLAKKAAEWQVVGDKIAYQNGDKAKEPFAPLVKGWKQESIYPANQKFVSNAVGLVKGLAQEHIISRNKDNFALYQVADDKFKASVQILDKSGNELAAFIMGKRGDDFASQFYRVKGKNYVLVSSKPMGRHFTRSVEDWRDKKIFHFVAANIREYSYSTPFSKGSLTLQKDDKASGKVEEGMSHKTPGRNKKGSLNKTGVWRLKGDKGKIDGKKVQGMLRRMSKLKAHGFLTETEAQKIDSQKPLGHILARNGTEHKLFIYGKLQKLRPKSDAAKKKWIIGRGKKGARPFFILKDYVLKRLSRPAAKLLAQDSKKGVK